MAEHYTRNTTGVLKFCNRCGRMTLHKVSGKKLGLCTENHNDGRLAKQRMIDDKPEPEPTLF